MHKASLLFVAVAITGAAHAQALFGVEVGSSAAQLPACEHRAIVPVLCRERSDLPDFAVIAFPTNSMPAFASEQGWVELDGDAITRVTVKTGGYAVQEAALAALTAKWGRPARVSRVPMQNAMGARFTGLEATWKLSGGFVGELNGLIGGDIDTGSIVLSGPRAVEMDGRHAADRAARQRKP